jgi:hypothetical protein
MKPAKHIIGLITRRDVEALREAVSMLPETGEIVEIGAFTGKSTVAIAEACHHQNKNLNITTFDKFEGLNIMLGRMQLLVNDKYREQTLKELGYTIDQVLHYMCKPKLLKYVVNNFTLTAEEQWQKFCENTEGYDNINVRKEFFSPYFTHWDRKVNMVFYDGDHNYVDTLAALCFWNEYLLPDGILVVHDYEPIHSDCMKAVDEFAATHNKKIIVPTKSSMAILC